MDSVSEIFENNYKAIIHECSLVLQSIDRDQLEKSLWIILSADKVFFVGVGRVLLVLNCIAKRFAHIGIKSIVVGDVTEPAITDRDVLIVGSSSGESIYPLSIAKKAKAFDATVIHIGANPESSMKPFTDQFLRVPVATKFDHKGQIQSVQPMTSLFEQSLLLLGDTVAKTIIELRKIDMGTLWKYHANLE